MDVLPVLASAGDLAGRPGGALVDQSFSGSVSACLPQGDNPGSVMMQSSTASNVLREGLPLRLDASIVPSGALTGRGVRFGDAPSVRVRESQSLTLSEWAAQVRAEPVGWSVAVYSGSAPGQDCEDG